MELIHISRPSRDEVYEWNDSQLDIESINPDLIASTDFIWYWYQRGSYEGSGQVIAHFYTGGWRIISLSHNSMDGPEDRLNDCRYVEEYKRLASLERSCSKDYLEDDIKVLINYIRATGYDDAWRDIELDDSYWDDLIQ